MKKKKRNNWPLIVTILAFTISLLFSFMSESIMPKVGIIVGIMILILFIFIGIIFDMIGVAVTSSNEEPLHAMSSKKIKGAKKAVSFKKNADKVSSFCNDVIGDICGIISGSAGVSVARGLASTFGDAKWKFEAGAAHRDERDLPGVPQQRGDEKGIDGLGEGRGMKIEDIKNVAVFFNLSGKTVALRMDAEQKRIVALLALNTTDARAELIEVPHMTLPADPAMQEAAQ